MRKFEEPIIEVASLDVEDVITTSVDGGLTNDPNGGGWG